ncbi:MAG: hypothetical protein AAF492_04515 [Verrucomicrobiota bacterium]
MQDVSKTLKLGLFLYIYGALIGGLGLWWLMDRPIDGSLLAFGAVGLGIAGYGVRQFKMWGYRLGVFTVICLVFVRGIGFLPAPFLLLAFHRTRACFKEENYEKLQFSLRKLRDEKADYRKSQLY